MNSNHTMGCREQSSTTSEFRLTMHRPVKMKAILYHVVRDLSLTQRNTGGPD